MNSKRSYRMNLRGSGRRAVLALAVLAASLWFAPAALAHTHVGFGISIGVGNCWSCGYRAAPPMYYAPAYPPPYYPRTVYYAPRPPVYYGYGYYGYYAPYHHRRHDYRYWRGHYARGGWRHHDDHHHRGHYHHGRR